MFFSVIAGIIPLSLRNGGGHLIPFAPLSASVGGATAPSAPRLRRLCSQRSLAP